MGEKKWGGDRENNKEQNMGVGPLKTIITTTKLGGTGDSGAEKEEGLRERIRERRKEKKRR